MVLLSESRKHLAIRCDSCLVGSDDALAVRESFCHILSRRLYTSDELNYDIDLRIIEDLVDVSCVLLCRDLNSAVFFRVTVEDLNYLYIEACCLSDLIMIHLESLICASPDIADAEHSDFDYFFHIIPPLC